MPFCCTLGNSILKHTSIMLAAIRHLQIDLGWGDPDMTSTAKLELVMRGIKRVRTREKESTSNKASCTLTRQPITSECDLLTKLHAVWWSSLPRSRDKVMLWAAASLCSFGFLRSGKITVPPSDLHWTGPLTSPLKMCQWTS